jgi:hypothetical protein
MNIMLHMHQVGNDAVITLDAGDQLILANVRLSTLNAGDFLFV